jgi:hypothetical protein
VWWKCGFCIVLWSSVEASVCDSHKMSRPSGKRGTTSSWQCQTPYSPSNPGENSRTTVQGYPIQFFSCIEYWRLTELLSTVSIVRMNYTIISIEQWVIWRAQTWRETWAQICGRNARFSRNTAHRAWLNVSHLPRHGCSLRSCRRIHCNRRLESRQSEHWPTGSCYPLQHKHNCVQNLRTGREEAKEDHFCSQYHILVQIFRQRIWIPF